MTVTHSMMYWLTRLDGLNATCAVVVFLGGFVLLIMSTAAIITSVSEFDSDINISKTLKSILKRLIPTWVFFLLGLLFIPTSKEMAMIYVVPSITESQVIKQDIPELYDLGVDALKDWLKNTKQEETKGA